jgi:small multidrug resistance pump
MGLVENRAAGWWLLRPSRVLLSLGVQRTRFGVTHWLAAPNPIAEPAMNYLFLAIAITAEVIGTSFMKLSEGFSRPLPSLVTVVAYAIAFYCLSLTLRTIPTGIAYAIWSGVGIVLIATIAWAFQGQKLDLPAMLGMALIIAGVLVMNLFSKAVAH